jgi:anhydro-N-acetylmuramic acid kinase
MKSPSAKKYRVIGVMSGTSLDGVDVAFCHFERRKNRWQFLIEAAQTFKYSKEWKKELSTAQLLSGEKLMQLHSAYGAFLGKLCNDFIKKNRLKPIDFIASHGHTIFHQPKNGFTFQLGDGNMIHAVTEIPVIFDFRSLDVALGGEGAPLVPIGDRLLFSQFDVCLNLGGIANLSMEHKGKRKAFDVCYCNMALNYLAAKVGKEFDESGKLATTGSVNEGLRKSINKIYSTNRKTKPSLGREGFENHFQSLLDSDGIELHDRLRTVCESISNEIADAIPTSKKKMKMLATGGGARNEFLIQLLREKLSKRVEIVIPDKTTIDFKEALVFAFLGVLRVRDEVNVLNSVTGAAKDSCSGILVGN